MGMKQNVSSPFRNMELVAKRDLTCSHSAVVEIGKLEPSCLYIAAIDTEQRSANLLLRVYTASAPRFRELSAPETQYLLQAQATAPNVTDRDSFSSQGSADNQMNPAAIGIKATAGPYDGRGPYDGPQYDHPFQADDSWREWNRKENGADAISFPKLIQ